MRKILILILLIILIPPVTGVRHEVYSEAKYSDEGIWQHFSNILKDAENCLDNFLEESPSAINLSVSLEHKVKLTDEESRFYAAKGVKSNVSLVVKPFVPLSSGIKKLSQYQSIFLKNIELLSENEGDYTAYTNARTAVISMKLSADAINESLYVIEKVELWNGTSKLYFDVSELKSKLKDVYDLIAYYESLLTKFEFEEEMEEILVVAVSDNNPFLYQEIKIYVYAKNVIPTALFIDDIEYDIEGNLEGNLKRHSFDEIGEHTIYAEGIGGEKIVKSNVVKVYVNKIPTNIVLSSKSAAFLKENVEVTGFLSDYYGNPLQTKVTVKVDGGEEELGTHGGFFNFNVTKSSEGFLHISTFYAGNETYESSTANTSIFFSRFPTSLYIEANKTHVNVNETISFAGRIYGVDYTIPIHIFVNSTDIKALNSTKEFYFDLNFSNPGTYEVYAYFPGNSLHKPAESNRIEIVVELSSQGMVKTISDKISKNFPYYFLLVIVVAILVFVYARYLRKKALRKEVELKVEHTEDVMEIVEDIEEEKEEVKEEIIKVSRTLKLPESVEEAYRRLFNTLVGKYNLKKSLTPRELLKSLRSEPFAEKLKFATKLHEKAVYSNIKLKDEEREMYFRLITEILEDLRR